MGVLTELSDDDNLLPHTRTWTSESKSSPGKIYHTHFQEVMTTGGDSISFLDCECPGWRNQKKCWHTTAIQAIVGETEPDDDFILSMDD